MHINHVIAAKKMAFYFFLSKVLKFPSVLLLSRFLFHLECNRFQTIGSFLWYFYEECSIVLCSDRSSFEH